MMNSETINRVYDILVEEAGAPDDQSAREDFICHYPNVEHRFMGRWFDGGMFHYQRFAVVPRHVLITTEIEYPTQSKEAEMVDRILVRTNKRLAEVVNGKPNPHYSVAEQMKEDGW